MDWISVDEDLPDKGALVLTYMLNTYYYGNQFAINRLEYDGWVHGCGYCPPTHWKPLDAPHTPKGDT